VIVALGVARDGGNLVDTVQETPCSELVASKIDWSPTIDFVWPDDPRIARAPFDLDQASQQDLNRALVRQSQTKGATITVEIVGQLRTRDRLTLFHDTKEGVYFGNGYGLSGMHPAQLVIKAIAKIDVH
jgi:hypothetical protein